MTPAQLHGLVFWVINAIGVDLIARLTLIGSDRQVRLCRSG